MSAVTDAGGHTTTLQYDMVYDADGSVLARYTYGTDRLAMVRGAATWTCHHDAHGSVRALTGDTGAITDTYAYDAYGATIARTGSTENPYRYSGERLDASGLYHLRARSYDPSLGRFTTRDSFAGRAQSPRTLHRYLYAGDDPVNAIDPTGLETVAELSVSQYTSKVVELAELAGKVRAKCKAASTIEQVSELRFYSNIAAQMLTLVGASLLPLSAQNTGGFGEIQDCGIQVAKMALGSSLKLAGGFTNGQGVNAGFGGRSISS